MPNWSYTQYKIKGSEDEVAALHKIIQDLDQRDESLLPNGFGKLWLGNLVHVLGGDWEKTYCRGQILNYSLERGILSINTETAWGELSEVRNLILHHFPGIRIYYLCEEPGMLVFETNDSGGAFFKERFILDYCEDIKGIFYWEYFTTLKAAADFVSKNCLDGAPVEATKTGIDTALAQYQEEHPDDVSFIFEEFKLNNN